MQVESNISSLLAVEPVAEGVFVGPSAPERSGRTYGGQFLAQALMAAAATVPEPKRAHSLHGYFVRAGDVDQPTHYSVEQIRDGRSFALRSVIGTQSDGEVFRLTASFHAPEPGLHYHRPLDYRLDELPPPSQVLLDYPMFAAGHPDFVPDGWDGDLRPMEMRYINPPEAAGSDPVDEPQLMWVRVGRVGHGGPADAEPNLHAAALAYLADGALIDHALLPHGLRWFDNRLTGTSLDHSMWFHGPCRADEWLLYDQRVQWTGAARGLVSGRFYDGSGNLVASCSQEGLMRMAPPNA